MLHLQDLSLIPVVPPESIKKLSRSICPELLYLQPQDAQASLLQSILSKRLSLY